MSFIDDKYEWMSRTDLKNECRKQYKEIKQLKKQIEQLKEEVE